MERMNTFQPYNDLPQIQFADDSPLNWGEGYPEPVQRFLVDKTHFTPGYTNMNINFSYGAPHQMPYAMHYEQRGPPFPPVDVDFPRDPSPETTSSSSSHVPQNELRPSHMAERVGYGEPDSYSQQWLPYTGFGQAQGGVGTPEDTSGGTVDPQNIEYEHEEPDKSMEPEHKLQLHSYEDTAYPKMEIDDNYQTDSAIGQSLRDPESVHPVSTDAEASDSDYKPKKKATKAKRRSSQSGVRPSSPKTPKRSAHNRTLSGRVEKKPPPARRHNSPTGGNNAGGIRPFPCPLAIYGCQSNFVSKNEWKRHVSTQHVKLGFWRCDLCPATVDTHDPSTIWHNDFNRKDLFTQHLRRMHAPPATMSPSARPKSEEYPVTEENLAEHHKRCYQHLRNPPPQSACLFCDRTFSGPGSWDERLEHVGRHLEKDRKQGGLPVDMNTWQEDMMLREWLIAEGLVEVDAAGEAKLGDGKPRRGEAADDEDDE